MAIASSTQKVTMTLFTRSAQCDGQRAHPTLDRPDAKAATRGLIIGLALVQSRLRSFASGASVTDPAPHVTAQRDQLRTHERHLLEALQRRRLGFRALASDDDQILTGSRAPQLLW